MRRTSLLREAVKKLLEVFRRRSIFVELIDDAENSNALLEHWGASLPHSIASPVWWGLARPHSSHDVCLHGSLHHDLAYVILWRRLLRRRQILSLQFKMQMDLQRNAGACVSVRLVDDRTTECNANGKAASADTVLQSQGARKAREVVE
jgi:hypothetical protein